METDTQNLVQRSSEWEEAFSSASAICVCEQTTNTETAWWLVTTLRPFHFAQWLTRSFWYGAYLRFTSLWPELTWAELCRVCLICWSPLLLKQVRMLRPIYIHAAARAATKQSQFAGYKVEWMVEWMRLYSLSIFVSYARPNTMELVVRLFRVAYSPNSEPTGGTCSRELAAPTGSAVSGKL